MAGVEGPPLVGQLHRVDVGEVPEGLGQIRGRGHAGAAHQHGDHADAPGQRCLQLHPDEVRRVVQATPAGPVDHGRPGRPDQRDHDIARVDRLLHDADEVGARLDGVDVHEQPAGPEPRGERLIEPAGMAGRILPPVADEDPELACVGHVPVPPSALFRGGEGKARRSRAHGDGRRRRYASGAGGITEGWGRWFVWPPTTTRGRSRWHRRRRRPARPGRSGGRWSGGGPPRPLGPTPP